MMREYTVVHKLQMAILSSHPFDKINVRIKYVDGDVANYISSEDTCKDDMISQLFDLSLRGYYVVDVANMSFFPSEQTITLFLLKSGNMRTNLNSYLMDQISQILDKV